MKKLAIIGGGVTAADYIDACTRIGYEPHYFSLADGRTKNSDFATFHEIDIFDKETIINICREVGIKGVVSTTELTVSIAAYVADKLGLPCISPKVAELITDKKRNRDCIKDLKLLKSPRYANLKKLSDFNSEIFKFPIIIKPCTLGGKRGLTVVKNEGELNTAFKYACDSMSNNVCGNIIVEEYLEDGIECSVESITANGVHKIIQITQKLSGGAPHCVELGHCQPAQISPKEWELVESAVSEGLTAIGLTTGACHTEVKIINEDVYLIEFNARPGGGCIAHPLTMLSTGFDYLGALAQVAVGDEEAINFDRLSKKSAGLLYVVDQTKHLLSIFEKCQNYSWCYKKHFVEDKLHILTKNDLAHTNYFIYKFDKIVNVNPSANEVERLFY